MVVLDDSSLARLPLRIYVVVAVVCCCCYRLRFLMAVTNSTVTSYKNKSIGKHEFHES